MVTDISKDGIRRRKAMPATRKGYETTDELRYTDQSYLAARSSFAPPIYLRLLPLVALTFHLALCRYSKVEESFHMQSIHDVFVFGTGRLAVQYYDHLQFPGVVPRSFIPSLILGKLLAGIHYVLPSCKGFSAQIIARLMVGCWTAWSLDRLCLAAARTWGRPVGAWFCVISAAQFHLMFWGTRTVGNVLMFGFVTWGMATLITTSKDRVPRRPRLLPLFSLAAATTLIRLDTLPLTFAILLITLAPAIQSGTLSVMSAATCVAVYNLVLLLSMGVDAYFWHPDESQLLKLTELDVFAFNIIKKGAQAYGISPWHHYFTALLPRICSTALPLAVVGFVCDKDVRRYVAIMIGYVAMYSSLGHKEWRFIIYVIPVINLAAAIGTVKLWKTNWLWKLCISGTIALTVVASVGMSYISSLNYPGGQAVMELPTILNSRLPNENIVAHIDSYVAQTGVTRFIEDELPHWLAIDKKEDIHTISDLPKDVSVLIWECASEKLNTLSSSWEQVATVTGFDGLDFEPIKDQFSAMSRCFKSAKHLADLRACLKVSHIKLIPWKESEKVCVYRKQKFS
ncbi:dolichyl-P-Man:Man(7)GlcNAc(2)-PP-dolichol alpha-1,6-mannosyltransferase [Gaertneriomyces sp. JEL0708]|nr:dolichyl-P-Man:Man(7)GlcNAc(2)-PP-dolichol alpha-1,6-mannosyltransferase [Gaertneriomyces sp. JEL0708]